MDDHWQEADEDEMVGKDRTVGRLASPVPETGKSSVEQVREELERELAAAEQEIAEQGTISASDFEERLNRLMDDLHAKAAAQQPKP